MTTTLRLNSELVTAAWIASIPSWVAGVASQLPQKTETWASSGFVTVTGVGGSPHPYVPLRRPVMQIDTWATQSTTSPVVTASKPPWYAANALAEWITAETWENSRVCRLLTPKANYPQARVLLLYPFGEPRRVPGEGVGIARFTFDLFLQWAELPP